MSRKDTYNKLRIECNIPGILRGEVEWPFNCCMYEILSDHEDLLTKEDILDNIDKPWKWEVLLNKFNQEEIQYILNSNVLDIPMTTRYSSLDTIVANRHLYWDSRELSWKNEVTEEIMRLYPDLPYDYEIMENKVSYQFIVDNPHLPWGPRALSIKVPLDVVKNQPYDNWNWDILSQRKSMFPLFLDRPDLPWNIYTMTCINNIDTIKKYPHANWDYFNFSSMFDEKYMNLYPDKNWNRLIKSRGMHVDDSNNLPVILRKKNDDHLTRRFILSNPQIKWRGDTLINYLSVDDIIKIDALDRVATSGVNLFSAKGLRMEHVINYPQYTWIAYHAEDATIDFIRKYGKPIDNYYFCNGKFTYQELVQSSDIPWDIGAYLFERVRYLNQHYK